MKNRAWLLVGSVGTAMFLQTVSYGQNQLVFPQIQRASRGASGGADSGSGTPAGAAPNSTPGNATGPSANPGMNTPPRGGSGAPSFFNLASGAGAMPAELTLKDRAIQAFQKGDAKAAYTLLESYALQANDEEAMEIVKDYRWSAPNKRPQFGVNVAVGVSIKNPQNAEEISPIGSDASVKNGRPGQGGRPGGSMSGGGMGSGGMAGGGALDGESAPGRNGSGQRSGSKPRPIVVKSLSDAAGTFGTQFVEAFKAKHDQGVWTVAFREYSLGSSDAGQAGSIGVSGFEGSGSGQFFGAGASGGSAPQGNGASGSGIGRAGMQPGNSGGGGGGAAGNSSSMGARAGMQPGNSSGGNTPNSSQGMSGGVPGMSPQGGGSGGNTPNSSQGMSGGVPGMSPQGSSGGNSGGNTPNSSRGMSGGLPGMSSQGSGSGGSTPTSSPGSGGSGGLPGMSPKNFQFQRRGQASSGVASTSTHVALAPCLTYIGSDETPKLIKKAAEEGFDGLIIFEIELAVNKLLGNVINDTRLRIISPNENVKEAKVLFSSKRLNNRQVSMAIDKGDSDGVEDAVEMSIKKCEEFLGLKAMPTGLSTETITSKRIPSLVDEKGASPIDRISEINLYYATGHIDEKAKSAAFEKIVGDRGSVIATGNSEEKLAAVEKLLESELKQ